MRKPVIIDPNRHFCGKPLGVYVPKPDPEPNPRSAPTSPSLVSGKRTIVPLTQEVDYGKGNLTKRIIRLGYLEARRKAMEAGGLLPSNITHDDYLVMSEDWKAISALYPAWAREIIVYPGKGRTFTQGEDAVDSETGWILPASELLRAHQIKDIFGIPNAGLFIDPEDIIEDKRRMIVVPRTIVVLHGMIEQSGSGGKVDMGTRLPFEVDQQVSQSLPENEKRWFWRIEGVGVRPLVRHVNVLHGRRIVDGYFLPGVAYGVALEAPEGDSAEKLPVSGSQ